MPGVRELLAYIARREGCIHPFRASRALVLANWRALEELGRPLADFRVEGFEGGFSIPELEKVKDAAMDGRDECLRINRDRKCVEYACGAPVELEEDLSRILDQVLDQVKGLDDVSLNRLVVRDPRYRKLLEGAGG